MSKPTDIIPVKYSEDLAQFAEVRAVMRQPMTLRELVGLVLTATGKQPERVRELLRGGTCTYNVYRYWWTGLELDSPTLAALLAEFPDPDPTRGFSAAHCRWAKFLDAQEPAPHLAVVEKKEAARRRWFRRQDFWSFLMELAAARPLGYQDYSYYHRADLYRGELLTGDLAALREACRRLAPRGVQLRLARGFSEGSEWARLELACARGETSAAKS